MYSTAALVRLGDTVRLTLHLVDGESGRALWADRIDGELPDLPALYRRVTGTVARSLDLTLQEVETARARARPGADLQDLLLQARWLLQFNRTTPDSLQQARRLLEQVSARDPGSGLAFALLAQAYNYDVSPFMEAILPGCRTFVCEKFTFVALLSYTRSQRRCRDGPSRAHSPRPCLPIRSTRRSA